MKKFFNIFFVTLGVIFLVLIIAVGGFFIFNSLTGGSASMPGISNDNGSVDKNPALSESQERALSTFGIDPSSVPTEITPEMEACFIAKLGEARVAEIKAGASPNAGDFFKAQACIS